MRRTIANALRTLVRAAVLTGVAMATGLWTVPHALSQPPATDETRLESRFVRGSPFVKVKLNGRNSQWFLIDTGAPLTTIEETVARSLFDVEVKKRPEREGVRPRKGDYSEYIDHLGIALGDRILDPPRVWLESLDGFSEGVGFAMGGIIGGDLLSLMVLRIDYEHRTIDLINRSPWRYAGDGEVVPILASGYAMALTTVTLEGGERVGALVVIDTGSNGTCSFSSEFVKKLQQSSLTTFTEKPEGLIRTAYGDGLRSTWSVRGLTFGALRIGEMPATVGDLPIPRVDGMVGNEVLQRFTLTLDLAQNRVILEANRRLHDPFVRNPWGLGVGIPGPKFDTVRLMVALEETAVARAGLQIGDELLELEGQKAIELGIDGIAERSREHYDSGILHIRVRTKDGVEKDVELVADTAAVPPTVK